MAITKNKGSGVVLLVLLVLAVLIYNVPGLEALYFGLPLLVQVGIPVAAIFAVAALVGYLKRRGRQGCGKKRRG
jgi:hypothetical protein